MNLLKLDPGSTIDRVVTVLFEAGHPLTTQELAAATGLDHELVRQTCREAARQRRFLVPVAKQTFALRKGTRDAIREQRERAVRHAELLAAFRTQQEKS